MKSQKWFGEVRLEAGIIGNTFADIWRILYDIHVKSQQLPKDQSPELSQKENSGIQKESGILITWIFFIHVDNNSCNFRFNIYYLMVIAFVFARSGNISGNLFHTTKTKCDIFSVFFFMYWNRPSYMILYTIKVPFMMFRFLGLLSVPRFK